MDISAIRMRAALVTATDLYEIRADDSTIAQALGDYLSAVGQAQRAYGLAACQDATRCAHWRSVTLDDQGRLFLDRPRWPADLGTRQADSYEFARRAKATLVQAAAERDEALSRATQAFRDTVRLTA